MYDLFQPALYPRFIHVIYPCCLEIHCMNLQFTYSTAYEHLSFFLFFCYYEQCCFEHAWIYLLLYMHMYSCWCITRSGIVRAEDMEYTLPTLLGFLLFYSLVNSGYFQSLNFLFSVKLFFFFFKAALTLLGPLHFICILESACQFLQKYPAGILNENALNL